MSRVVTGGLAVATTIALTGLMAAPPPDAGTDETGPAGAAPGVGGAPRAAVGGLFERAPVPVAPSPTPDRASGHRPAPVTRTRAS